LSFNGSAGFALMNNSVLVLPLTQDEAVAAVAVNTASVWPSNSIETSRTAAEASINNNSEI
jgi:hypothetical protein